MIEIVALSIPALLHALPRVLACDACNLAVRYLAPPVGQATLVLLVAGWSGTVLQVIFLALLLAAAVVGRPRRPETAP